MRRNQIGPRTGRSGRLRERIASVLKLDGNSRQLMRGGLTSMSFRCLGLMAGYVFTFLLARKAGAEAVGGFAIYFAVLSIAVVVGKAGMDMTLLRFISDFSNKGKNAAAHSIYFRGLIVVSLTCIALTLILLAGSRELARSIFNKESLSGYLNIAAISILPATLIVVNAESLRALKRVGAYAFFQMASNWILATLFLVVIMLFAMDDHAAVYAYFAGVLATCILSFAAWHRFGGRKLGHMSRARHPAPSYRKMLSVSLPILISGMAFMALTMTDTLMLGVLASEADVGVYNICIKMVGLGGFSLMAVNSLAAPRFAESYGRRDFADLQATVRNTTRLAFWSSAPVFLILLIFPSFLLGVFGTEFNRGTQALLILTAGQIINVCAGAVAYILQMTGRERGFLAISLSAAGLNVVMNLLLIPRYGINGAAIASTSSIILFNLGCAAYAKRSLKISTLYLPFMAAGRFVSPEGAMLIDEPAIDEQNK